MAAISSGDEAAPRPHVEHRSDECRIERVGPASGRKIL